MVDRDEQQLMANAKAALEQGVADLDAQTLSRITRARYRALDRLPERHAQSPWRVSAGVALTTCMAFMIFIAIPRQQQQPASMIEDIEVITTTDELDLYEQLDFYAWLEEHELPT